MYNRRRRRRSGSIYSFIVTWLVLSMFFPMYELTSILTTLGLGLGVAFLFGRAAGRQAAKEEQAKAQQAQSQAGGRKTVDTTVRKVGEAQKAPKKSYGPEVDPIVPWRPPRGSLTSPSYLVRNRTLGPPLENHPETPPSSRR